MKIELNGMHIPDMMGKEKTERRFTSCEYEGTATGYG